MVDPIAVQGIGAVYGNWYSSGVAKGSKAQEDEKLKELCKDFEAIMVSMMIKSMRSSVPEDGLIPDTFGEDVFRSMLDDQYAALMVQRQDFGIAQKLYDQLSQADSRGGN
ncbi:rod-binding protein [Caldanaerobius polysaccharolyticus]|uniref:rod-binding protein n=1 Tax=Caldanaerobius polysaccharolyticus TaxID=44256 RepID=UPI00068F6B3E|nr:rod-binding protein [Caldanaerobius polysaccharolyticus]